MFRVRTSLTGPQGAPWLSTMYFSDTFGDVVAAAAVAAVAGFWDDLKSYIANDVTISVSGAVYEIDATSGQPIGLENVTAGATAGTSSSGMNPLASQGLMQWRTGYFVNGRELRGRTFLPGLIDSAGSNGQINPSFITLANTAASDFIAITDLTPCIWGRASGTVQPIASGQLWDQFAVLRSRRD